MSRISVSRRALVAVAVALVLLGVAAKRTAAQNGATATPLAASDMVAALGGAPWRIVDVSGKRAPAGARIMFSGPTISGSAGCNRFFAPLVPGAALRVGSIQSTLMMCKDRMDGERAIIEALRRVRTATRAGDTFELRDETGAALLTLVR